MSSLHQDRLLAEGTEPAPGCASTLAPARGTSRRPAAEKATSTVPQQRQGTAQRSGSAQPTTDAGETAPRTRPTTGVETAAGALAAEAAAARTPRVRPTPHVRTVPVAGVPAAVAEEAPVAAAGTPEPAVVADAPTDGLRARLSRLRPPAFGRRPRLYLAAAVLSALGLASLATSAHTAQATDTVSSSVSVAEELGIQAAPSAAITDTDAAQLLGELAVSRNARDADQAAAAQAQAEADRVAAEAAAEAARPKAVLPVQGARLTSQFGARWGKLHAGIDLAAPMLTPEYAAMDGVVLEAGPASGYGLVVYIQHENGDVTVYGHMDSILVGAGQVVRAGDTIALLGNRGQSTGPHLHFEVHVGGLDGQKIDPLPWLRDRGVQI